MYVNANIEEATMDKYDIRFMGMVFVIAFLAYPFVRLVNFVSSII